MTDPTAQRRASDLASRLLAEPEFPAINLGMIEAEIRAAEDAAIERCAQLIAPVNLTKVDSGYLANSIRLLKSIEFYRDRAQKETQK